MEEFDPGDEGYWKMNDFENYSKSYECNGKLGRIWRNGVNFGKKMVITGVMVSSAPFFLPPLMAISAIGVAFSVPAGFVLATYACGEKLLNTLLPMPSSTPYEENESMYGDKEDYRVYGDDVDKGYESDDDLDIEEQKIEVDIRKGLEMRIELVVENDKQFDNYDGALVGKDELDERSSKMSEIIQEEILEAENGISFLEKEEGWLPRESGSVEEGYEEDVGEYMADEEPPLDAKEIPDILEGINEAENEIPLMTEQDGGVPKDSFSSAIVAAQAGKNDMSFEQVTKDMAFVPPRDTKEENEFAGMEEDKPKIERTKLIEEMRDEVENDQKRKDSSVKETPEYHGKSGIVPVRDLSHDKGNKGLTISEEVEPIMDDWGVKTESGSKKNVEQVTKDMAFIPTRDINEKYGFSGINQEELRNETTGLIEKMRDEGRDDWKRKQIPAKETPEGNEELGIGSVQDMSKDKGNKNVTIPKVIEPATEDKSVMIGLEGENNVVQVTEDMALLDIHEENGCAVVEEEELRSELTRLNEKMRDVGNDNQKRKGATKETPEEIVGSGGFSMKDMSEEKGNTDLTFIFEGLEPDLNDKGAIFDLKGEANLEDTSIQQRDEPKSAVESQVVVDVKIDGDHTLTGFHQGTGSDKLGNLILSHEDTEMAVEGGFDLSDNGTVTPHEIVDSFNKMLEGEVQSLTVDYDEIVTERTMPVSGILDKGQSLDDLVEATVDYHEVVIESTMPVSEHAETAKDQGTAAGYKVKQEEEKLWEQINAMRTIVGYTNTPHLTCAEELKALYDFTGVELPISSNDPTDLVDINKKLHFLMSIIGVK